MCGIVGILGKEPVAGQLLEALKRSHSDGNKPSLSPLRVGPPSAACGYEQASLNVRHCIAPK